MSFRLDSRTEWLEADGLGGFASAAASGLRTRRYHALLLRAATPPTGRQVLVNGVEVWVETPAGKFLLTPQVYFPNVRTGGEYLASFEPRPWPRWTYRLPGGIEIEQELFVPKGRALSALSFRLLSGPGVQLTLRPLLSGRDYHALHHENPAFNFEPQVSPERAAWRPYEGMPAIVVSHNGVYLQAPEWYRHFFYEEEEERGLDFLEDLASPGMFQWNLAPGSESSARAAVLFSTEEWGGDKSSLEIWKNLRDEEEKRRKIFKDPLFQSADSYFVVRGSGLSLIAGYPWFTDWGRDTFISLRGLGLACGKLEESGKILRAWAGFVSQGMVPNRCPDAGEALEYNSVDASLWYVIAAWEYFSQAGEDPLILEAVGKILSGYAQGTRYGIGMDSDGLLWAGEGDSSLTWMDARVNGQAVTPRVGKPVEVQALWLNALWIGAQGDPGWEKPFQKGLASFREKFWNASQSCLYDVVDAGREPGKLDPTVRPNQLLAAGGLPFFLLENPQAFAVVEKMEKELLAPLGLRSLSPQDPRYRPRYEGGVAARDGAYHQGTVWPWLLGPFIEAWVKVRGNTEKAKKEARVKFLEPLLRYLNQAGLGHLPEIADAEEPFIPRGCPFQAWSLGEAIRLDRVVLR
jgi:predicted glycogen debranching enzyme